MYNNEGADVGLHAENVIVPRQIFRVWVLGETSTGKTSLIRRLVNDYFPTPGTTATNVGMKFHNKAMFLKGRSVLLQLWDATSFDPEIQHTDPQDFDGPCLSHHIGLVLVYDVTDPTTLDGALRRVEEMESYKGEASVILLANKMDGQVLQQKDARYLDRICRDHGFHAWFAASAKNGQNVATAFSFLATRMIEIEEARLNDKCHVTGTTQGHCSGNSLIDMCACS